MSNLLMDKELHLVSKATMGATLQSYTDIKSQGYETWLEIQLHPDSIPNGHIDRLLQTLPSVFMTATELMNRYPRLEPGELANALEILDSGLEAFITNLGSLLEDVAILIMSEFGRTARQNGSGGTDHGHGTSMFVIGDDVNGGHVYGSWPGLSDQSLYQGRNLEVTTDFRRLFGEEILHHMGCADFSSVFPGYDFKSDPPVAFLKKIRL